MIVKGKLPHKGEWVASPEDLTKEVIVKLSTKPITKEERGEILLEILNEYCPE